MNYLKWLALLPVMLVVTALTFPLAPVLPFFAKDAVLPKWLSWFQTPDNTLDGDNGWKTEHWQWRFKLPAPICTYVGRVGWLWRNPGYGVGVVYFDSAVPITATYSGNPTVNDSPGVEGRCLVNGGGLFQFVWVKRISRAKCIYVNIGWNIKGLINAPRTRYTATYAFSPRISTWKD